MTTRQVAHWLNESRITVFWMVVCVLILLASIAGCVRLVWP